MTDYDNVHLNNGGKADELLPVSSLSERELLIEIATNMRAIGAMLDQFSKVGPAGLLKMALGGSKAKGDR